MSLAVDFTGATPSPLPNLDFKIECGDSLTAPDPQELPDLFRFALVQKADAPRKCFENPAPTTLRERTCRPDLAKWFKAIVKEQSVPEDIPSLPWEQIGGEHPR